MSGAGSEAELGPTLWQFFLGNDAVPRGLDCGHRLLERKSASTELHHERALTTDALLRERHYALDFHQGLIRLSFSSQSAG